MLGSAAVFLAMASLQGGLFGVMLIAIPLGVAFAPFAIETTRALLASGTDDMTTPLLWTMTLLVLGNAVGSAAAGAVMDEAGWRVASVAVAVAAGASATALSLTRPRSMRSPAAPRASSPRS
jgi:hypothetical protein